jgi:AraC family transcriptional regulator of adaptative response/methylated-DNA-[protein]-cysteine methyltransferase
VVFMPRILHSQSALLHRKSREAPRQRSRYSALMSARQPATAPHASLIAALCRHIETAEHAPSLDELAAQAHMSPHHLHRVFKAITGVTPKAYADAVRARRVQTALMSEDSVTGAWQASGYTTASRFYEASARRLGMRPAAYRRGGEGATIRFAVGACSLGAVLVAASEAGLCAISLGDDPAALTRELQDRFPRAELIGADPTFEQWVAKVVGLVESPAQAHDLPLDIRGTAFQQRVWQALQTLPPGQTLSYSQLAQHIGAPRASRAVAAACAANQLAVAIPCHRVVRLNGDLGGYRWGVERKQALLQRESQRESQPDGETQG